MTSVYPRVCGSKVRIFATRAYAEVGAKAIGWPAKCVTQVSTRFQRVWALGTGIDLDPDTALPYVSREWFARMWRSCNDESTTDVRTGRAIPAVDPILAVEAEPAVDAGHVLLAVAGTLVASGTETPTSRPRSRRAKLPLENTPNRYESSLVRARLIADDMEILR